MKNGLGAGALALVLTGTSGTLLSKLLYQLEGPGRDGTVHPFEKPWACAALMFVGMAACLPAAAVARTLARWLRHLEPPPEEGDDLATQPLLQRHSPGLLEGRTPSAPGTPYRVASTATVAGPMAALWGGAAGASSSATPNACPSQPPTGAAAGTPNACPSQPPTGAVAGTSPVPGRRALALILVPTCFDLAATVLMSVGLLYITASVFAMVRGSEVVFAALLSTSVLRRHLNRWHLGGIALCTVGITLVGAASFLEGAGGEPRSSQAAALHRSPPPSTTSEVLLGMGMVLAAEAVQAAQVIAEDLFMHSLDVAPLTVVGWEGLYGMLCMCAILPVVQRLPGREGGGLHEDSLDTLAMLGTSRHIRSAALWYMLGLAVYNVAGMLVTDSLGAVTRTVLETLKTLLVWCLNLLAFYASDTRLGEPWTQHSWLQALGFVLLVGGTLVYAQGEEAQARRLRARLLWARLHDSLAAAVWAARPEALAAARAPLLPPRIAGPARFRTAFLQPRAVVQAVEVLEELLRERRAAAMSAEAEAMLVAEASGGGGGRGGSWVAATAGAAAEVAPEAAGSFPGLAAGS